MSQSDHDELPLTPVLSESERRAAWEAALVEEVRRWRDAASNFGVQDPRFLTTSILNLRSHTNYMDQYVFSKTHDVVLANNLDTYWENQYEEANRAWEGRERFLAKFYAQQASGGNQADPDSEEAKGQ